MGKDFYQWIFRTSPFRWGNSRQGVDSDLEKQLKPYIGKRIRMVDLGCGSGRTIDIIARPEWEIWGVDYVPEAVNLATSTVKDKAKIILGDMTKTPFEDNYFDVVYSCGSFEHLDFPEFKEPFRIMKKDGVFICTLPVGDKGRVETQFCLQPGTPNWGTQWEWFFTVDQWTQLFHEGGFKTVDYVADGVFVCRAHAKRLP